MEKHKIDKILSLKDEVKDFQPLLYSLFSKLPGISAVELRQGPNEKGADFVLRKDDLTLGTTDYVGVIVKVGTVKQNHHEVDRQIEECEMERFVEGARRKIVLNEIWVVSNDGITANAQDAIHHKYKHKNIKFIPGERVCELIDKHFPAFWSDANIDVGNYLREITTKSQSMAFGTAALSLPKKAALSYNFAKSVPQTKGFRKKKQQRLTTTLRQLSASNQFLFLDAMMGMGKSTALGQLAAELSTPQGFAEYGVIPAVHAIKDVISGRTVDVEALVNDVRAAVGEVPASTGYLVMLDAMDEVEMTPAERVSFIKSLYDSARKAGCSLIVTSREIDEPLLVSEVEKRFARFNLLQLSISQVVSLISQVCKVGGAGDRLKKELEKSVLFRSLPRTPISVTLLTKILDENVQEIPSTMTELYSKYMELVLGRWDMTKGLLSQMEYDVILSVSSEIATFLLDNSLERMSIDEAREICRVYVRGRNLKVDPDQAFSKMLVKKELYFVSPFDGTLSFAHRTFAEFFYADRLHRQGDTSISERVYDPYWMATYFFRFGLKRDAPELLERLDAMPHNHEVTKLYKLFHHSGYLLAAYLTPYEKIKASIATAISQAASLYVEIHTNKASDFRVFSEVQLLCIFTKSVCASYGYEYFRPALLEIATEIFCADDVADRLTELFFVNSALADTSYGEAFDTMIKNYGPNIPLFLQVGIVEQSEDTSIHSDTLDRYIKNHYRKRKGNLGMLRGLQKLVHDPLNKGDLSLPAS